MSHFKTDQSNSHSMLYFLDGIRGLTALYVVLYHSTILLWEGFFTGYIKHPQLYTWPMKFLAYGTLLFYYGHQAVLLFFILSGFVIHLRYARQKRTSPSKDFDLGPFLWRRFKRIYPPLIAVIVLTLILDSYGALILPQAQQTLTSMGREVSYNPLNVRLVGALFLIPGSPAWGSAGTLWSLQLEWWFYVIYPFLWLISRRSFMIATLLIVLACTLTYIPGFWPLEPIQLVFASLIVWWFGALLAEIYVGNIKLKFVWLSPLSLGLIPLAFTVEPFTIMDNTFRDVLWGLAFAGLFATLFAWQRRGKTLEWLSRFKPLGNMSYSLYLIHQPILTLLSAWIIVQSSDGLLPIGFQWIVGGVLISLVSAYILYLFVERPFQREKNVVIVNERSKPPFTVE